MKITKDISLKDLVKNYPQTIEVLNTLSIDFCCGGDDTIEVAVNSNNQDLEETLALLEKKAEEPMKDSESQLISIENFKNLSINEMIDSLKMTHHKYERELMLELDELINTILLVHYENHKDQLVIIHNLFATLKMELEEHFAKEEQLIFKIMKENKNPSSEIIAFIDEVESEHDVAGDILKKLKVVTNNFKAPSDGCYTYNKTFETLETFVNDVFVHVFKENSILFPEYREKKTN